MKKLFRIIILLISSLGYSQLKTVIINSETKEKIPYVNIWLENENIGTTSNGKGEFNLENINSKIIVFSAVGFETRKIKSDLINEFVQLKPIISELDEVIITSKKKNKKLRIGKIKIINKKLYLGSGKTPLIIARHYKYEKNYKKTPFLKKIRVLTKSEIQDSKFNIRIYSVNKNEEPGNYIHNKNIIGIAKKGKTITEIDISKLNIEFPENGLFIAFEWLIIEENKYELNYTHKNLNENRKKIKYAPRIIFRNGEKKENTWRFYQGKWNEMTKNQNSNSKKKKYNILEMELILTN